MQRVRPPQDSSYAEISGEKIPDTPKPQDPMLERPRSCVAPHSTQPESAGLQQTIEMYLQPSALIFRARGEGLSPINKGRLERRPGGRLPLAGSNLFSLFLLSNLVRSLLHNE